MDTNHGIGQGHKEKTTYEKYVRGTKDKELIYRNQRATYFNLQLSRKKKRAKAGAACLIRKKNTNNIKE